MDYAHLLPKHVKIGATRYTFVPRDEQYRIDESVDGQVSFDTMEINVVTTRPASEVANTVIHELLHVCYREWHIKPKCGEERTVTAMGFALTALFAQNPTLLASIAALLGEADE